MPWKRKKIDFVRMGERDAKACLSEGWRIAKGLGKAWEMINPDGEARYWITADLAERLMREYESIP